jgi:hypothetical protein
LHNVHRFSHPERHRHYCGECRKDINHFVQLHTSKPSSPYLAGIHPCLNASQESCNVNNSLLRSFEDENGYDACLTALLRLETSESAHAYFVLTPASLLPVLNPLSIYIFL